MLNCNFASGAVMPSPGPLFGGKSVMTRRPTKCKMKQLCISTRFYHTHILMYELSSSYTNGIATLQRGQSNVKDIQGIADYQSNFQLAQSILVLINIYIHFLCINSQKTLVRPFTLLPYTKVIDDILHISTYKILNQFVFMSIR